MIAKPFFSTAFAAAFLFAGQASADPYEAMATGDWSNPATWMNTVTMAPGVPGDGDTVTRLKTFDVTVDVDTVIGTGSGDAVIIDNTGRLVLAEGVSLTLNGDLQHDGYRGEIFLGADSKLLFNPGDGEIFELFLNSQEQRVTFDGRLGQRATIGLAPTAEGHYYFSGFAPRDARLNGSFGRIEDAYNPNDGIGWVMSLKNDAASVLVARRIEFVRCGSIQILGTDAGANTVVDIDGLTFRDQQFPPVGAPPQPAFRFDGYQDVQFGTEPTIGLKRVNNIVSDTPINIRFVAGYELNNYVLDSPAEAVNMGNARTSNLGGNAVSHNNVFRADFTGETMNLLADEHITSYLYSEVNNPHGWSTQQLRGDALVRNYWFESNFDGQNDAGEAMLTNGAQASLSAGMPAVTVTLDNSGTIGDSSSGKTHPALFAFNDSQNLLLKADHNLARIGDGWHAIQLDEGLATSTGTGIELKNSVFFGDAPDAGFAIGRASPGNVQEVDTFQLVDFNLYHNLRDTGPDGNLGVHEATFSAGNPVDLNSLRGDPDFFDPGRNLQSWDASLSGGPGSAQHAIEELKKRNDDVGYNPAYTVEALVEYVAVGYAIRNTAAVGNDGKLMGPTLHPAPRAPEITTQPQDIEVAPGEGATLSVAVSGNPEPTLQWYQDELLLVGETSELFEITEATSGDGGDYYVIATNSLGSAQSNTAIVTVADIDSDGDGVSDTLDNCTATANADQTDTDGDGYGNVCDADLNGDCTINRVDMLLFRRAAGSGDLAADFNVDGNIDRRDLLLLRRLASRPIGPSGLTDQCPVF